MDIFMVMLSVIGFLSDIVLANRIIDLKMPSIIPNQNEQYLCRAVRVDSHEQSIIAFKPNASMHNVHHMLLYACAQPGLDIGVWDCRDMYKSNLPPQFPSGRICNSFQRVIYAWAKEAPELRLPDGVGFKVGGNTGIEYLVLQVHYLHSLREPDISGISVVTTNEKLPKTAGVLFMASNGILKASSVEKFEISCSINDNIIIHPFGFRVHTHDHGRVVSGYLIRNNFWQLIGKKDPQLPQMFYPVADPNMIITSGDTVAARCTMINDDDHDVYIGPRADNEMCNFYLMYWVDGDTILSQNNCFSHGPPSYHWNKNLINIPETDASTP